MLIFCILTLAEWYLKLMQQYYDKLCPEEY